MYNKITFLILDVLVICLGFADGSSLPAWGIGLMSIGVILFVALVIVVPVSVACCYKKRRAAANSAPTTQQVTAPQVGQPDQKMAVSMQVVTGAPIYAVYNPNDGSVMFPQAVNVGINNPSYIQTNEVVGTKT